MRFVGPLLLLLVAASLLHGEEKARTMRQVSEPPRSYELDPFYRKYVDADGLPVLASARVSDYALLEAAWLIDQMLANRPDVRQALVANKVRFAVMAFDEMTTDIPEHSDLTPARYWNRRARGLGSTRQRPAVSCGEENLLGYPGDPYASENILIHEFAHAIHQMGLNSVDEKFDDRLRAAYEQAMAKGLWKGTYAASNAEEYWAEGVQSWFDANRPPDQVHNEIDTREELRRYDPDLAALIAEALGESDWRYVPPAKRAACEHLNGYDAGRAPRFQWPREEEAPGREDENTGTPGDAQTPLGSKACCSSSTKKTGISWLTSTAGWCTAERRA